MDDAPWSYPKPPPIFHEHISLGRPSRDMAGFWEYGVWLPGGPIKQYSTRVAAEMYIQQMEGVDVIRSDGTREILRGLKLMRRWMGAWEGVPPD